MRNLQYHRLPGLLAALALAIAFPLGAEDHSALGHDALARGDYPVAIEHLETASRELEGGDREQLATVQIDLGIAYLTGAAKPGEALRCFVRAADLAANPASAWLWASTAALQGGDQKEAERYKELALRGRAPAPAPAKLAPAAAPTPEPAPVPKPTPTSAPPPALQPVPATVPSPPAPAPPAPASPAPPIPEPVAKVEPTEAPAPTAPPAPTAEKPTAFGHFFGEKKPAAETEKPATSAPVAKAPKDRKDAKKTKVTPDDRKKEAEAAPPEKPAGSAFDHFFKRQAADETDPPAASEPPPSGRSVQV